MVEGADRWKFMVAEAERGMRRVTFSLNMSVVMPMMANNKMIL